MAEASVVSCTEWPLWQSRCEGVGGLELTAALGHDGATTRPKESEQGADELQSVANGAGRADGQMGVSWPDGWDLFFAASGALNIQDILGYM